ncbi:hypothetical protein BD626DRAFT_579475 [Schizophyllum amplum]|uniref:Uncharacterized protein n=1 Tax=Schizophyllum amplum TaxID=97359 RepID=A0A550BRI7_9AGAR|nr:hypothetical protein BD626DRAFT_579475 [Auriculariopsis ampla]
MNVLSHAEEGDADERQEQPTRSLNVKLAPEPKPDAKSEEVDNEQALWDAVDREQLWGEEEMRILLQGGADDDGQKTCLDVVNVEHRRGDEEARVMASERTPALVMGDNDERNLWAAVEDEQPWDDEYEEAARMAEQAFARGQLPSPRGRGRLSSGSPREHSREDAHMMETQSQCSPPPALNRKRWRRRHATETPTSTPDEDNGRRLKRLRRASRSPEGQTPAQPVLLTGAPTAAALEHDVEAWLDMEADHSGSDTSSGEEVDEKGASGCLEGFITLSDADDGQGTGATVRKGPFGGARELRARASGAWRDLHTQSTANRAQDEYSVGSFVVDDEDEEDDAAAM